MAPVLGYWDMRGLVEPIRYLLHYLNVDFVDKRYEFAGPPDYLDTEWSRHDKHNLGLELANLPYYIDGDIKITQSAAIMRHLSRMYPDQLYQPNPKDEKELIRFETVEGHARDLMFNVAFIAYNPSYQALADGFKCKIQSHLGVTAEFLKDKKWLFGDQISFVDFILYEGLDFENLLYPGIYNEFDNLVKFVQRVRELPGVSKYMETSKKWPLFMPYAIWGGSGEMPTQ